ncbi:hypothetical protein LX36DRAFT_178672 [Colletotrichum falcatum]|nr:hypothetical protein LX36DRAFT_178672 [Colletotrichum falcatum]
MVEAATASKYKEERLPDWLTWVTRKGCPSGRQWWSNSPTIALVVDPASGAAASLRSGNSIPCRSGGTLCEVGGTGSMPRPRIVEHCPPKLHCHCKVTSIVLEPSSVFFFSCLSAAVISGNACFRNISRNLEWCQASSQRGAAQYWSGWTPQFLVLQCSPVRKSRSPLDLPGNCLSAKNKFIFILNMPIPPLSSQ